MKSGKSIRFIRYWVSLLLLAFQALYFQKISAQAVSFIKVNASNGLSANLVYKATRDKNGLIWIATSNGLNSFNGYEVATWHHITDSVLTTRDIRTVFCDDLNNIWLTDANGRVGVLDKNRKSSTILFEKKTDSGRVRYLLPASGNDMFMLIESRLLKQNIQTGKFYTVAQLPDSLIKASFLPEAAIGNDQYLLPGNGRLACLDLRAGKVTGFWRIKNILAAVKLPDGNLLATTSLNRELFKINWQSGEVMKNYGLLNDQTGNPTNGYLRYMAVQADGQVVMSSGYSGIYLFNPKNETLLNYAHDPLESKSISGNNTYIVSADKDGYVFVTTRSSGLNFYNIHINLASTTKFFRDYSTDKIFDGFVSPIQQDRQGHIWLGSQGGIIEWDKNKNSTTFHDYGVINGVSIAGTEEVRRLWFDKQGRLWVGLNRYGVVLLDKQGKTLKYFSARQLDSTQKLAGNFVMDMTEGPDQNIWVSTAGGLSIIDVNTLKIIPLHQYPSLEKLASITCNSIWVKSENEVWFASTMGVFTYLLIENKLDLFNQKRGLVNSNLLCITGDEAGNVYTGGRLGLERIKPDGSIDLLDSNNISTRHACVSIERDDMGNMWIGSDNDILCYQPALNKWHVFDASYGFTAQGYRFHSSFKSADGQIFFGGNQGVSWFFPKDLLDVTLPVSVLISGLQSTNANYTFTTTGKVNLGFNENSVSFQITPIALYGNRALHLQYKLEGFDKDWFAKDLGSRVTYPQLPPGNYTFKARFTLNGNQWQPASNEIQVYIATPWWRQTWFRLMIFLLTLTGIFFLVKWQLARKARQREEEETEKAVIYLTSSMHSHISVEDMLWDVCRNCISKLQLEDSVIYVLDPQEKVLRQTAAWRSTATNETRMLNPVQFSLGEGRVGMVAQSGKPEIINEALPDNRRILNEQKIHSEICVPIIADGEVLGVIDSRHSKKQFFEQRHISILTTIASLLGSKIMSTRAEEEKSKAEIALLENRQRISEVEMQALRAQMNPHFMFNSLNSINNFILKNDADNASAYLTRFARLMRLILDNSREDWISLESELKALQLYIEMESLRFDNAFDYNITIAPNVSPIGVLIPPMIIQPYVENAIWHGLMHRKDKGSRLQIAVEKKDDYLEVKIEDNGVGREAAQQLKSKFGMHKKSHGMQITNERLRMVNAVYEVDARTEIRDVTNADGGISGTCVILTMKYKQHEIPTN